MQLSNQKFYNCEVITESGDKFLVDGNWLHNNNIDCWLDWKCNAGSDRIYITADLDIYSGQCKNDYLGNLLTNWDLLENPTVCKKQTCTGCTDDLILRKEK